MASRVPLHVEVSARRMNKAFDLLQKGYSQKKVRKMLGVDKGAMNKYVAVLRESFKKTPSFIPPRLVHQWSVARAKRVEQFIELAKAVIEGRASIERKPRKPLPRIALEKDKAISKLLKKNPKLSDIKIAAAVGVNLQTVATRRRRLVERRLIPDVSWGERIKSSSRKPERITNVLSKQRIENILAELQPQIEQTVKKVYFKHRIAFDFANLLPEQIADEIAERMRWKLKVFAPWRKKKKVKDVLRWWIDFNLEGISTDLVEHAWRRYRKVDSLAAPVSETDERERIELLEGLPATDLFNVSKLQEISTKLKINPIEEAVLFGTAAGFYEHEIGDAIGCAESRASQIRTRLFKRVKRLLEK